MKPTPGGSRTRIFPRKASGDAEDGEEEEEGDAPVQELCSMAQLGKNIAAWQGDDDAIEEGKHAKANEDVGNLVGDDEEEAEEAGEGEREEGDDSSKEADSEEGDDTSSDGGDDPLGD
eukprot:jgi/Tetstr1/428266/TSEL_018305.t1